MVYGIILVFRKSNFATIVLFVYQSKKISIEHNEYFYGLIPIQNTVDFLWVEGEGGVARFVTDLYVLRRLFRHRNNHTYFFSLS